jgi:Cu/Ag efflux protein CusF
MRQLTALIFLWITFFFTASSVFCADTAPKSAHAAEPPHEHQDHVAERPHEHPANWRFTLPKGDPVKGRSVFIKYECYNCHEVRGENFPEPFEESAPELSQMGPEHPIEFFAESIINPNAVVPKAYQKPDGTSPMRDFTERMTLRELIDVSAYIASLKPLPAAKLVQAVGKIIALSPQSNEIVIEHGAIKDYMDAMTMGYNVSSASLLRGLTPGDQVEFTLDTQQRVITKIEKRRN